MGQFLGGTGRVTITVEADAPRGAVIRIACDGRTITQTFASSTFARVLEPDEAGRACQAVVGWPEGTDRFVTWAVSNPIYFRDADPPAVDPALVPAATRSEALAAAADAWRVEHAANAEARLERATEASAAAPAPVRLVYTLSAGARASQYAALVTSDVGILSWAQWLTVRLSADRPMRVSLQLREPTRRRRRPALAPVAGDRPRRLDPGRADRLVRAARGRQRAAAGDARPLGAARRRYHQHAARAGGNRHRARDPRRDALSLQTVTDRVTEKMLFSVSVMITSIA